MHRDTGMQVHGYVNSESGFIMFVAACILRTSLW